MSASEAVATTNVLSALKSALRSVWMSGDFGVIAHSTEKDAEAFAQRIPLTPGSRVLDVATGTGNLALPLACRGLLVTGVDIAPNLLEQARARAAMQQLLVQFDEGDAEALPYADGSFDAVVTMFGAMFAPRPELVATEFARVLRPGGVLAMANWTPGGFTGQTFAATSRHAPPPAGVEPPVLWGDPATVQQRLAPGFEAIQTEVVPLTFDLPLCPDDVVKHFRRYYGPTQAAYNRLDAAGCEALTADLVQLWSAANTAGNPDHHTIVANEYLQVLAVRK